MKLRSNAKYALVCPTSMGIRLTPVDRQMVQTSDLFKLQATSAESNVLSVSAALGLPTKALTKFVEGSPVARLIQGDLRRRGIEYEGASVPQGDAWGFRHQINIADSGYGLRGPRVWNDRSGEVGRTMSCAEFDLDRLFQKDGVAILHLSGLIAALSPETAELCLALARRASEEGTKISFDLNYRASFWKGREAELAAAFREIASLADILVGNEEDFQLALGVPGPEAGGGSAGSDIESFQQMIGRAGKAYPHAEVFATTLRQVKSANEHLWGAILLAGDQWHVVEPRTIPVLDRIGGGDAFVGGLLYGILKDWPPEKWVRFGWATGALCVTQLQDYAQPADEAQVWDIYAGNARVKR